MDAMHAAIKAKRSGKSGPMMNSGDDESEGQSSGMSELVAKLSPDQKEELMELLSAESEGGGEVDDSKIAKGAPSSEERSKIEAKIAEEPGDGEAPVQDDDESDEIAMSMTDRSYADRPAGVKPKSLGERAKVAAAQRLREKGKL